MDIDMVPEGPKHIPPFNSRNQSSLGELLLGFLRYYTTEFRYLPRTSHHSVIQELHMHMCFFPLLLFPLCSSSLALPANFFSPSSPPSVLTFLCPASSSLVSCCWRRGRSRWDLWPYTALTWHAVIPVFAVCVIQTLPCHIWKAELKTRSADVHRFELFFFLY